MPIMTNKKFQKIRYILMGFGTIINVFLIVNFFILLYNLENQSVRHVAIPIFLVGLVAKLVLFIFFGRLFCGFLCPAGFFQDLSYKFSEKIHFPKIYRNTKLMKIINVFSVMFLVFFLLGITTLTIFILFFPGILAKANFPFLVPVSILGAICIICGLFARRFFCNLCPYGSFIGLFEKLNLFKLNKNNDLCSKCGACYDVCPMRIKEIYLEDKKTKISNSKCIFCGECVKKCPKNDAIYISVKNKIIVKSSTKEFLENQYPKLFKDGKEK